MLDFCVSCIIMKPEKVGVWNMAANDSRKVVFSIEDMLFEYDEEKNRINIKKHGISFQIAARVFF